MREFLVPNQPSRSPAMDPYTERGARNIVREYRDDVVAMLRAMDRNRREFDAGKTFLAKSPLARKIWVAAAMKTLGLVEEQPSPNGSCALVLTDSAIRQMASLTGRAQ